MFESRVDPPLLRAESDTDPVLSATSALAGLMGTNLSLPAGADTRLEEVTEDRLIPIAGREQPARLLEPKLNLDAARIAEQVERDLLDHLRSLPPARFEELCALYLRVLGCEDVQVVGAAAAGSLGDGGMDVTGTLAQAGLPAVRLAVQAKRVTGGVGPNVVTQLRGSIPPGTYGIGLRSGQLGVTGKLHIHGAAVFRRSRLVRRCRLLGPCHRALGWRPHRVLARRLGVARLRGPWGEPGSMA